MEQVAFFIDKISYGWFDDSFKGSDWQVAISASDAWAQMLLRCCCRD